MFHIGEHLVRWIGLSQRLVCDRDKFGCRPWRMFGTKLVVGSITN
jgi:hypothetical protein